MSTESAVKRHEFTPKAHWSEICKQCGGMRITPRHGYDLAAEAAKVKSESAVKHTAGPWNACHDAYGDFVIFAGEGITHKIIAITDLDSATDEANAGLIAAAPALLEALEQCLLACRYPQRVPDMRSVVHAAEAAIRKAKGE